MNEEPYYNNYLRQSTRFEFYPSKGLLIVWTGMTRKEFDMKDVFFLHGWLGSMIMHYMDEIKAGKSKHSKQIRKIMRAEKKLSYMVEVGMIEDKHE